jgi:hypothetical protein
MEACSLMRQALIEQHQEQGESLQAAELYDARLRTTSAPPA